MSLFERYVGIDYSGAATAEASLAGLRIYEATQEGAPQEVMPPASPRKYWTRRGLAEWLCQRLSEDTSTIVGIDHAFSFPLAYFEERRLSDWPAFLDHFQRYCPLDEKSSCVDFVREGDMGSWSDVSGNPAWLRLTEQWTVSAKSVFRFDVQGAVAKSTYAGLPWLRHVRQHCNGRIHFWPFDGWDIPKGVSVVAEVYPSLWMKRIPQDERTSDQHAAYAVTAWRRRTDLNGSLTHYFNPPLAPEERKKAEIEGWILGVI
jgi:hypothetical protein